MKNLKSLKEERLALITEMKGLGEKARAEKRDMTNEEYHRSDTLNEEISKLDLKIAHEERVEALEAQEAEERANETPEHQEKKVTYSQAFEKFIRSGGDIQSLNPAEQKLMYENRSQTVTTTGGGYTIAEGFMKQIETAMLAYGGMMEAAYVFNTSKGNDMPMPTMNDTSNKGAILDINIQESNKDLTYGQVIFKAYKYTSKQILLPLELLQDSEFDIMSYTAKQLGVRIGRILNEHFTTGNNSSKPQGVVTGATKGEDAAATAITRDNLLDLLYSVDPEYQRNGIWMFNANTLKAIRKLSYGDADARPLYQVSAIAGEPATIEGKRFVINQDVADIGASAKCVLFGDFSKYFIRQVLPMSIFIFNEKYMDYYQKAVQAFGRWDGRIVDAGTNPIKYIQNAAS